MRRKLAGRSEGAVYDRLLAAQTELSRGADGAGKPMSLTASTLAKVAKLRTADISGITRIIGDKHADRFGEAFLEILQDG
jgi:ATP-dependent DNA helicase RecQ